MIFVDRSAIPAPEILLSAEGKGLAEAKEAELFYKMAIARHKKASTAKSSQKTRKPKKTGKSKPANFEFEVYRDKEVKQRLSQLFHNKCAYCEFRYAAGITGDVEHYRPKGRIDGEDGKSVWPGYYWLATDWDNLLPSCRLCNSPTKLTDLIGGQERTMGKANFFPLEPGSRRAKKKRDLEAERPLILNPCKHDPSEHLEFFEKNGHKALIRGKTEAGRRTVEICGLNRAELVRERLEILSQLETLMFDIQRAYRRLKNASDQMQKDDFQSEIGEKRKQLHEFEEPDRNFSALARSEIKRFLRTAPK
jgi:hypothetical protein